MRQLPIEVGPPEHTDYKAIVQPYFSVSKRPKMEKKIGVLIGEMINETLDAEPVEIINEFGLPLQSRALTVLPRR